MRTQVAYAVANIASIEVPRKEWLDLIPNLCDNCGNENVDFKNAALETLGFICEELGANDITDELKNKVIFALTSNISADPALTKSTMLAVNAFQQALPFASQNFKVNQEREYIISRLFEAFKSQDEDIRTTAM